MRLLIMLVMSLVTVSAFAVGTTTVTKSSISYDGGKKVRVVELNWLADGSGVVPAKDVEKMHGFLMKMITDPGTTAPTASYDIAINDSEGLDALITLGVNRHTTTTEVVYPVTASGQLPIFFPPGTYSYALSGNSVALANGQVKLYFVDSL